MKFEDYRACSVLSERTTTFRILILRWDQALLLTSDPPSDNVSGCPYVSKLWHCTIKKFCEEEDNEISRN